MDNMYNVYYGLFYYHVFFAILRRIVFRRGDGMFIRVKGKKPLKRKFGAFMTIWGKWGWDGEWM